MALQKSLKEVQPINNGVRVNRFFVGKGVFITEDVSIPVNAISVINVIVPPRLPYSIAAFLGVIGLVVLCFKYIRAYSILFFFAAALLAFAIYYQNEHRIFSLRVQTHSGFTITIGSEKLENIRELKSEFLDRINDMSQMYSIDMSKNSYQTVNNIKNIGGNNMEIKGTTIGGDFTYSDSGSINVTHVEGTENSVKLSQENLFSQSILTDLQWKQLAQYFSDQSGINRKYRSECATLSSYAKNKDESGIKKFMKKLGSATMTEIISAGTKEILHIIRILLKG